VPEPLDHASTKRAPVVQNTNGAAFPWMEVERATGSPTIAGNVLGLQFEGSSTFEAWIDAIDSAQRFVYFENYLVRDDRVGRAFRDALVKKAREGVPVCLVYDWLGCWATPRSYWKPLIRAGAQVRAFNRPSLGLGNPFGAVQRDHRKLVVIDGDVCFVGGFCLGDEWAGTKTEAPWRDTGIEIRGPAALSAARAFEAMWNQEGDPLFFSSTVPKTEPVGDTPVWLIEGEPGKARVYRSPMRISSHLGPFPRRSVRLRSRESTFVFWCPPTTIGRSYGPYPEGDIDSCSNRACVYSSGRGP
jgi:cardiolipin synthase